MLEQLRFQGQLEMNGMHFVLWDGHEALEIRKAQFLFGIAPNCPVLKASSFEKSCHLQLTWLQLLVNSPSTREGERKKDRNYNKTTQ